MKKQIVYLLGMLVPVVTLQHCSTSDKENCADGYYYDNKSKSCELEINNPLFQDSGVFDAAVSVESTGIGIPCTEHSQCTGSAYYCVVSPFTGLGYCTFENCTITSCPEDYNCCDCTVGPFVCGKVDDTDIQRCTCVP